MSGLDDNAARVFEDEGFLFFPSLFSVEEVAVLRAAAAEVTARAGAEVVHEPGSDAIRLVYGAHRFNEAFGRLGRHPRLIGRAERLIGASVYIHQSRLNPKAAFAGESWAWHQDFATWNDRDGMARPRAMMVAVFIEEVTAANAPLLIIPRSHRGGLIHEAEDNSDADGYTLFQIPPETIAELAAEGGIAAQTGAAGSVLICHCNIVHGSSTNITPLPRAIYYLNYAAVDNPPTNFRRAEHHCTRDWSAIAPLADDCLTELAGAANSA